MEKSIKKILAVGASVLFLSGPAWSCSSGRVYQANDLNQMWGKPVAAVKTASGSEMRYYWMDLGEAAFYRVFEVMPDGKVVDKGMDATIWKDHR
jgi:hypothetical protein